MMRHSAELFEVLQELLKKADASPDQVERCCITAGPGSFTGLRIAVTTAKMLRLAGNVEIVAADTMDVLAENVQPSKGDNSCPNCIATLLDAKKNFFYAAVFDRTDSGWKKCLQTQVVTAGQLLEWLKTHHQQQTGVLGEGLVYYADAFRSPLTTLLDPSTWSAKASRLLRVGHRMAAAGIVADPLTLTPTYLSRPDAVQKQPLGK
jgi:tRNA threonylcarbamoyladenosine biosynthesis protein TsaB